MNFWIWNPTYFKVTMSAVLCSLEVEPTVVSWVTAWLEDPWWGCPPPARPLRSRLGWRVLMGSRPLKMPLITPAGKERNLMLSTLFLLNCCISILILWLMSADLLGCRNCWLVWLGEISTFAFIQRLGMPWGWIWSLRWKILVLLLCMFVTIKIIYMIF